jgi:hypothetical protein
MGIVWRVGIDLSDGMPLQEFEIGGFIWIFQKESGCLPKTHATAFCCPYRTTPFPKTHNSQSEREFGLTFASKTIVQDAESSKMKREEKRKFHRLWVTVTILTFDPICNPSLKIEQSISNNARTTMSWMWLHSEDELTCRGLPF